MKIAVVGAGITGLSAAQLLKTKHKVDIYEKQNRAGGLIKCKETKGFLYHTVGGHVFNSLNTKVLNWFWSFFDKQTEFIKASRKAMILLGGEYYDYPIENNIYKFKYETVRKITEELFGQNKNAESADFENFLLNNFGKTLYDIYFKPYNSKIWKTDLSTIPLDWLEGKLPMPDPVKIFTDNITRKSEKEMVHSEFYYPLRNGSQFIVDRLSKDLNIYTDNPVTRIEIGKNKIRINQTEDYDTVIYTGDIRKLPDLLTGINIKENSEAEFAETFKSNGTTNVLCETIGTDMSWLYLPDSEIKAHRIIFTGNFSKNNNPNGLHSCVAEFSGRITREECMSIMYSIPFPLSTIDVNYEENSYVIQNKNTRKEIARIKSKLEPHNLYMAGRFAEWEYYNMDKCIERAMQIAEEIDKK